MASMRPRGERIPVQRRRVWTGRSILTFLCVAVAQAQVPPLRAQPADGGDSRYPLAPLHEQVFTLPGDPARPVSLQVTLFTPPGPGPFPLAVMNHGATNANAGNRGERYHHTYAAYYFLSRGYAVALPMMRGFAGSGGSLVGRGCLLEKVAELYGRDLRAVIDALLQRPEIDRSRLVVAGQSFGGWNTLGLATNPPAAMRGMILFNPAIRASDCQAQDASMAVAAGVMGAQTRLPSLWFYGENDSVVPGRTWRSVFSHFTQPQNRAQLVNIGRFGDDSHQFLSSAESLKLWTPKVDAFLAQIGLPSKLVFEDFLPRPPPAATQFASLADVAAVPFVGENGRAAYQKFLTAKPPRAFVVAPNGAVSMMSGSYDATGYALQNCAKSAAQCRLYAYNDDVVWQVAGQPARAVARNVAMNVATLLAAFYTLNHDCTSRGLSTLSVVEPPAHGALAVARYDGHPSFPPNSTYASCNAALAPAMGMTYTPSPGFQGSDAVTVDEVNIDGRRQTLRISLTVK